MGICDCASNIIGRKTVNGAGNLRKYGDSSKENRRTKQIEQQIEQGHLQQVFDVEFGYALYNDPNGDFSVPSIYDVACYYAVPSWVVHGIYMDNPKQAFVYRGRNDDELNDDIRNTPEYKTLIVNAQTGEMLDPKDKSQRGYGDARYKGFIPWDKVK